MWWPVEGYLSGNNRFSRPTKNCRPPKPVDGIFEDWWHLRKFWWVKQIVRIEKGFASTDFFAKQTKFRVVRTGPLLKPHLQGSFAWHVSPSFATFLFFFCIYELFSPQWLRIISREDIAAGTFKIMLHGKIGPSDVNTSIIPTLIKNYVDANKFNGRKSELLNVASHSISSLVWRVSYLNNLSRTRIKNSTKELVERT